jgi:hypothetical protein
MYTYTCNCDWSTSSLTILAWYIHAMKSGGIKLVLWTSISSTSEMMRSCKYFLHVGKLSNLTYNWVAKNPPKKPTPKTAQSKFLTYHRVCNKRTIWWVPFVKQELFNTRLCCNTSIIHIHMTIFAPRRINILCNKFKKRQKP